MNLNLSPSSLGMWYESQLQFYYTYVVKAEPDTDVVQCYGLAGQVAHAAIEFYCDKRNVDDTKKFFLNLWEEKNLDNIPSMNGKPLSKQIYWDGVLYAISLIEKDFNILETELKIEFPFIEGIGIKGIVDVVAMVDGHKEVIDWKTSNSIDEDSDRFRTQVLFYCYLYYKRTGEIITNARIVYSKLKKQKILEFTENEVRTFESLLRAVAKEILYKGEDILKYEIGEINGPFNAHKRKCQMELMKRENKGRLLAIRKNNRLYFENMPTNLLKWFNHYFCYEVPNSYWIPSVKAGRWDGKKRFYKYHSFPYPFYWKILELIDAYNKQFDTTFWLDIKDERVERVVNKVYDTKFDESSVDLRDYQLEALEIMEQKKVGIVFGGTSFGKTLLASEFIKRLNRRTLFIVNRIELSRQTKEVFEDYLGVEIGEMSEGNLDISKQITVACIQTMYAILKREDETSKELIKYLYNVTTVIYDEAQNLTGEVGMYGTIADCLGNVEYCIALSGSPFRNAGDTLEMNSLVGFIIYTKTTEELERDGWIVPIKSYFLSLPQKASIPSNDYHKDYQDFIVKYDKRNEIIKDIVDEYREDKKIIILVKSIEHGEILNKMIDDSVFIYGGTPKKERKDNFKKFKNERGLVMISMVKILGSGIDVPDLDILINASCHGSDVDSIQIHGRLRRKSNGKKYGIYIDFSDEGLFQIFARKRKKMLENYKNYSETIHYTQWKEKIV